MNPQQFPHEPCSKGKKKIIIILHSFSSQVNVYSFEDVLIFLLEKDYFCSVAHDFMI